MGQYLVTFALTALFVLQLLVKSSSAQIDSTAVAVIDSAQVGWLQLKTDCSITSIWIDSVQSVSVDGIFQLPAGEHFIRVRGANLVNYFRRDATAAFRVLPADTTELEMVLPKYNMIYSEPYGAEIWADGKLLGSTPFLLLTTNGSPRAVILKKPGYQDSTIVEIGEKAATTWIQLQKDLNDFRRQNNLLQLKNIQRKKQARLTIFSFGLTLASGTAAYLFKKEANWNYERYQIAGNLEDIHQYYNLTRRYDRLAAGSYILFECNLLSCAYLFFRYALKP